MKTISHSVKFAAFILSLFLTTSASANLTTTASCINYKGENITQFELDEVEIIATRLPKHTTTGLNTTINNNETIYLIELPEVVINESITDFNKSDALVIEAKTKEIAEPISKPVISTRDLLLPAIKTPALIIEQPTSELKKRPFLSFVANKVYKAGFQFLKTINDGLFFKS